MDLSVWIFIWKLLHYAHKTILYKINFTACVTENPFHIELFQMAATIMHSESTIHKLKMDITRIRCVQYNDG